MEAVAQKIMQLVEGADATANVVALRRSEYSNVPFASFAAPQKSSVQFLRL